jgi:hypothetical protein
MRSCKKKGNRNRKMAKKQRKKNTEHKGGMKQRKRCLLKVLQLMLQVF